MAELKLEPPESCDECNSDKVRLILNEVLFGVRKGAWPYVYHCEVCKASVGCHPGTFEPMGRMAGRRVRRLRHEAHVAFDQLWQGGLMNRTAAYRWLAEQLRIPFEWCHIAWLTEPQLRTTIIISTQHFNDSKHIAERRKAKRYGKFIREREYEKQRIERRKSKR
jgi:hypothetical protein